MPELLKLSILVHSPHTQTRRSYELRTAESTRIKDVCQQIWEDNQAPLSPKTKSATAPVKSEDFGIFLHDESGGTGRWLKSDRTLEDYGVTKESVMEFKPRRRLLKIRFQDNSEKKIAIDQSLPMQQLLPAICEKMGISNHDEFDLIRIPDDAPLDQMDGAVPAKNSGLTRLVDPSNYNPATLDTKRMQRLKKKLATEDDVVWVNQALTLDEQGISENDVLLLRRRYFYSDRNVDARDPIQLNLLYVQCRNAILSGTHPVTLNEAIQFAGLQGQVEYQDFSDSKRGVDIRTFLPRNLNGGKKMDKKQLEEYQGRVQVEWQTHHGLSDIDAKDLYIKMARSLKTYGITFFLVKEKMKGRNKLIPRLFGVTRSAVLRLDEKTKETLSSRTIESIAQWAVTDNTLSLDFGDNFDERQGMAKVYSIQTKESKQIAQLISGYAELIRKRQRRDSDINNRYSDYGESEGSGESQPPAYEDIGDVQRRTIGSGKVLANGQHVLSGQVALPGVLRNTYADRQDVHYIGVAQARVAQIIANFAAPFRLPPPAQSQSSTGSDSSAAQQKQHDMEEQHKVFSASMGHVSAAVAQLVNLSRSNTPDQKALGTDGSTVDHEQLILNLINNLDELAKSLREMAPSTTTEQSSNLMISGQAFCQSFSDLLDATDPVGKREGSAESRQGILVAVAKIGETGRQLAESVRNLRPTSPDLAKSDHQFIKYCQQIGAGTTDIVRKAKTFAGEVPHPEAQKLIIHTATELALQSAEVIASTKLLRMCSREDPSTTLKTTEQLLFALAALQQALEALQGVCRSNSTANDAAQRYAFEIDEGALVLLDVLDNFKADLKASVDPRNDKVLNALFLLNHQMSELDRLLMAPEENTAVGDLAFPTAEELYARLLTDMDEVRLCVNAITSDSSTANSDKLNRLLELLQILMQDTLVTHASGEWESEEERIMVLNHLKTVYETAYQFVSYSGSTSTSDTHQEDTAVVKDNFTEALDEFAAVLVSLQENKSILIETLTDLNTSLARVDIDFEAEYRQASDAKKPVTRSRSQTADAIARLQAISEALDDMTGELKNVNPEVSYYPAALRELAGSLCGSYRTACDNWADFHSSRSELVDETSKTRIHKGLLGLGHACTELMRAAVSSGNDPTASAFPEACKKVLDQISHIQLYLNTLNCGTQSCGRALSTIEEVAEDLETAIAFASAGTVEPPRTPSTTQQQESFDRDFMLLIERLQASLRQFSTISTQQDLSIVVEETLRSTVLMVDTVRTTTAHLGHENADAHVAALRALKNAATAVADAIRGLKTKFGLSKPAAGEVPSAVGLAESTEIAGKRVDQLARVVTAVEQAGDGQGKRLLLVLADGLLAELKDNFSPATGKSPTSKLLFSFDASDLESTIDQLNAAVAKLDGALVSGADVDFFEAASLISQLSAGNLGKFNSTNTASAIGDSNGELATASRRCLSSFTSYLENIIQILSTSRKDKSSSQNTQLAAARTSFYTTITYFKTHTTKITTDFTQLTIHERLPSPSWQETAAQTQVTDGLSEAAAKIEQAARKLEKVQARRTVYIPAEIPLAEFETPQDFHDPVFEFDENVLDACKAIMAASAALIPVAGKAQEELVLHGRVSIQAGHYSDSQWSQGFISAARAIGLSCQTLVDAANALMIGHATEEKLISAAKQVASFTSQLLLACRVKGDQFSPTMKRLLVAGNVVRKATDQLVQVFLRRRHDDSPDSGNRSPLAMPNVVVNKKLVGGIAQEIKANEQVLKRERELVDAQKHLLLCRKAKYADRSGGATAAAAQPVMDELAAQEKVLIKERELQEARDQLLVLRQLKYGANAAEDEFAGYGANTTGTLTRRKTAA